MRTSSRLAAAALALLLTACGDATSSPSTEPGEVVLHDNVMAFVQATPPSFQTNPPPQPQLSFQFVYDDQYAISAGQPWQGVSSQGGTPGTPLEITVLAGRHKTTAPATWFNGLSQLLLGYALEDSRPAELNFALAGSLVIDGSSYPIALGQGSDLLGLSDDWWFGAPPGWTRDSNGYLHTPDGKYVVCPKNGGFFGAHNNAFQIITPNLTINCAEA